MDTPEVLENCDYVWEMELAGIGGAPIPDNTGERSPTAALGTQITDIAYRLMVCQRVGRSEVMDEWVKTGGHPHSMGGKIAGMIATEAADFFTSEPAKPKQKPQVTAKPPPYTHTRILLGANTRDHLEILRDSFPAGSIRRRGVVRPDDVPNLSIAPVKVPYRDMTHFPVFNDAELMALEILPGRVTEVPMEYGRAITTTTQPPSRFMELRGWEDRSTPPETVALFSSEDEDDDGIIKPGNIQTTTVYDDPPEEQEGFVEGVSGEDGEPDGEPTTQPDDESPDQPDNRDDQPDDPPGDQPDDRDDQDDRDDPDPEESVPFPVRMISGKNRYPVRMIRD